MALTLEPELIPPLGLVRGRSTLSKSVSGSIVHRAKLIMQQIPAEDLTASAIAKAIKVDRKTLYSHFIAATGASLGDAIKAHKLITAQKLLRESDANISTIAQRVGYAKESAFIYAFRQQTGMTPGRYRADK